jgi:hypothetical protein
MSISNTAGKYTAFFLIAQFICMWTAFFILSSAINWPASLDDPASVALPRLIEQAGPVLAGYSFYLLVGLLLVPATAALNHRLGLNSTLASLTMAFAVLSAIAKSIGISRWLFAMPSLAQAYVVPGADQSSITLLYETLNAYAGNIGEMLGVSLFSGAWTLIIGYALVKSGENREKWLGGYTFLTGLALFGYIPNAFGYDPGPLLTISGMAWQFALLGIGLWALSKPKQRA